MESKRNIRNKFATDFLLFPDKIKALANEDTLLPTQMFPRLPARATFVADTNFVSGTQKNVSEFVQKHFVSATNVARTGKRGNICVGNNVSATMCPRLPGP